MSWLTHLGAILAVTFAAVLTYVGWKSLRDPVRSRDVLYTPLTECDEEVRRDTRYRVGRCLDRDGYRIVALSFLGAIGLPVAAYVDRLQGYDEPQMKVTLASLIVWLLSLLVVYAWWFFARQDHSEKRRSYRFSRAKPEDDLEVADAKSSLLSAVSTPGEREGHFNSSSVRALAPGRVSRPRRHPPKPAAETDSRWLTGSFSMNWSVLLRSCLRPAILGELSSRPPNARGGDDVARRRRGALLSQVGFLPERHAY